MHTQHNHQRPALGNLRHMGKSIQSIPVTMDRLCSFTSSPRKGDHAYLKTSKHSSHFCPIPIGWSPRLGCRASTTILSILQDTQPLRIPPCYTRFCFPLHPPSSRGAIGPTFQWVATWRASFGCHNWGLSQLAADRMGTTDAVQHPAMHRTATPQ